VNFRTLVSPVLNNAGNTAFLAFTNDEPIGSRSGIWWETPQGLMLVARSGDHAPGAPDGAVFGFGVGSFHQPLLNNSGQIAFIARYGSSRGIWATHPSGELQLIVSVGDQLEVAPGDVRRILELGFASSTPVYPGDRSFNDRGQIVFRASFAGGTSGIFVSNAVAVPEPTMVLFAIATAAIFCSRRRFTARRWSVAWIVVAAYVAVPHVAHAVTIDTVPIGNPGNTGEFHSYGGLGPALYGAVSYAYRIGKYEVTNLQYVEFLNSVDPLARTLLRCTTAP
jgi:hypothetical protein